RGLEAGELGGHQRRAERLPPRGNRADRLAEKRRFLAGVRFHWRATEARRRALRPRPRLRSARSRRVPRHRVGEPEDPGFRRRGEVHGGIPGRARVDRLRTAVGFRSPFGDNPSAQTGGMMRKATRLLLSLAIVLATVSTATAAGDAKSLENTPQVKAYRAQVKAIQAGDYEAYKKTMTKASAAGMDQQMKDMGMDKKKGMEM